MSETVDLVNILSIHQYLFIEYAIDDYLFLDEHFHSIYGKVQMILDHLEYISCINDEVYYLEKNLLMYLPFNYSRTHSLSHRLALTLSENTSELFSSSSNSLVNFDEIEEENDGLLPSTFFFSTTSLSIHSISNEIQPNVHHQSDHRKIVVTIRYN